jgi:hypothetical protein
MKTALSQKRGDELRGQGKVGIKEADTHCTLNRSLSVDVIRAEMRRPKSGPALALKTYREKPTEERFTYVVKALLHSRGMGLGEWERHRDTVRRVLEEIGE